MLTFKNLNYPSYLFKCSSYIATRYLFVSKDVRLRAGEWMLLRLMTSILLSMVYSLKTREETVQYWSFCKKILNKA